MNTSDAADATKIVPHEVHDHEIFGPALLVQAQFFSDPVVFVRDFVSRRDALDRLGLDNEVAIDPQESFRGRAGNANISKPEESGVWGRISPP
ncbi:MULTISPECIES: hypothetical protein [unclassified Bradyrhizobium]|uniref:hypothetical protein n=1 Tax=unclassified Bradyrhizobium TaxID=2631580 RepID=UPI00201BC428|nr:MULTISPECIES: hypothetical protein [unclassified Bradyrhizobium]